MASVTDSAVSWEAAWDWGVGVAVARSAEVPFEAVRDSALPVEAGRGWAVSEEEAPAVRRSRRLPFGPLLLVVLVLRWSALAIQKVFQWGVTVTKSTCN